MKNRMIAVLAIAAVGMTSSVYALPIKDGVDFGLKYEGDVDPFSAGTGNMVFDSLVRGGSPNPSLGTYGGTTGYIGDSVAGILDLNTSKSTTSTNAFILFKEAITLDVATGYTVEFRVKAISSNDASGSSAREGLAISAAGSDNKAALLYIGTDRLHANNTGSQSYSVDNSSDFVVYRMSVLAGGGVFNLYRDGVLLDDNIPTVNFETNFLAVGDQSGAGAGHHQLDYIYVDNTGAFEPVPEPASAMLIMGGMTLMMIRRRRHDVNNDLKL